MADRYNFSLTTFSSNGKLVQIEYALNAVAQGHTAIGIKARDGCVVATERKSNSILVDDTALSKVYPICKNIGLVYAGMGPDSRVLVNKARKSASKYRQVYGEDPPTVILVREIAAVMQEYTQSGGVRPFGVSLLVIGYDENQSQMMYQVDPSGSYFPWKATAIGKNQINAKTFLERRYNDEMELEDAIHTAILALKEGMEGAVEATNLEIGIIRNSDGLFHKLSAEDVKDHLVNIQ